MLEQNFRNCPKLHVAAYTALSSSTAIKVEEQKMCESFKSLDKKQECWATASNRSVGPQHQTGVLGHSIRQECWATASDRSAGPQHQTGVLGHSIRQECWATASDRSVGPQHQTGVLGHSIRQECWATASNTSVGPQHQTVRFYELRNKIINYEERRNHNK